MSNLLMRLNAGVEGLSDEEKLAVVAMAEVIEKGYPDVNSEDNQVS